MYKYLQLASTATIVVYNKSLQVLAVGNDGVELVLLELTVFLASLSVPPGGALRV